MCYLWIQRFWVEEIKRFLQDRHISACFKNIHETEWVPLCPSLNNPWCITSKIIIIIIIIIIPSDLQPFRHVNVGGSQRYFQMSYFCNEMGSNPVGIITPVIGFQGCIMAKESETFHNSRCIQMLLKQFPRDILNSPIKPRMNVFGDLFLRTFSDVCLSVRCTGISSMNQQNGSSDV